MVLGDSYADTDKFYPGDSWDQGAKRGNFSQLNKMKIATPGLKTMISVGGWTWSAHFSDIAISESSRETFAQSAVDFVVQWGFDGVDIDWEYPVEGGLAGNDHDPKDKENFTALLKRIRELLNEQSAKDNKTYMISIASSANVNFLKNYEFVKMCDYIDFINLMSYDFHGPFPDDNDVVTGLNAALYSDPKEPEPELVVKDFNVAAAVQEFIALGVPKSKINAGLAFYGRGFGGVTVDDNNGLFAKWTKVPGIGTWAHGVFDYWDLKHNYVSQW